MDVPTYEEWQSLDGKAARKEALQHLRREFEDKDIRELWGMKPATWYNLLSRYQMTNRRDATPPPEVGDADQVKGVFSVINGRPQREANPKPERERAQPGGRVVRFCSVEGCEEAHMAKGLCHKHYNRLKAQERRETKQGPQERQEAAESQNNIPSDRHWPRKNVVDAEYTVVDQPPLNDETINRMFERKREQSQAAKEAAKAHTEQAATKAATVDLPFPMIKGTPAQLRKQFEAVALFLEGHENEQTPFEIQLTVARA